MRLAKNMYNMGDILKNCEITPTQNHLGNHKCKLNINRTYNECQVV